MKLIRNPITTTTHRRYILLLKAGVVYPKLYSSEKEAKSSFIPKLLIREIMTISWETKTFHEKEETYG